MYVREQLTHKFYIIKTTDLNGLSKMNVSNFGKQIKITKDDIIKQNIMKCFSVSATVLLSPAFQGWCLLLQCT